MPISLSWEHTDELLNVIIEHSITGVSFGNLNKAYDLIEKSERPATYRGGISGKPCFHLSNALIDKAHQQYADTLTIIGCGGIFTPEDALYKFELGSSLIQVITGMIYEGPSLVRRICERLESESGTHT
jgi:dihydroorotate dehydrogenase